MRALAILIAMLWFFAWLSSPSAIEHQRSKQKADSLEVVNKYLMENLKTANTSIDWANEIIANPKLILRVDSIPVHVFREKK